MTYKEENNILLNTTYKEYFYDRWKNKIQPKSIEFIFSPYCDLKCKYCYLNHHYDKQFPINTFNPELSIQNALKICEWMVNNHYTPTLNIFSGELFAQESGFKLIKEILDFYEKVPEEDRVKEIIIPTNGTFCADLMKINRVEHLIQQSQNLNIPMYLSFSIDGKYMDEENRPGVDRYYDRIFDLMSKYDYSVHPMLYSHNIDKWIENFDWFQSKMNEFNIPWSHMYLLQVRNKEWTREQNYALYNFLRYIIRYSWHKCKEDTTKYFGFLYHPAERGFNILSWLNSDTNNGYSCSVQHELSIRLNDMKVFPCHRLMYPEFEIGQYNNDMLLEASNVSLGIAIPYIKPKDAPLCSNCDINELCQGGCLGSQYETTKSILTPIPTVCLNYIYIFKALVDGFDEIGVLDKMMERFNDEKKLQINKLRRININEL